MRTFKIIIHECGIVALKDILPEYIRYRKAGKACPDCGRKIDFDEWYIVGRCCQACAPVPEGWDF